MEQNKKPGIIRWIRAIAAFVNQIKTLKGSINNKMEGRYSPKLIAMIVAAGAAILVILMLFIPNYLGVADDGSITKTMNSAGVYYVQDQAPDQYNNYFVRTYLNIKPDIYHSADISNSQILMIKAALWLDNLLTRDQLFDIRFLGLIYGILYVPAIYLLVKQACMRVKNFSEGFAIGMAGLLIFADVAYISYFNSFYPEAVWFVSLLYVTAAAVSFQESKSMERDVRQVIIFVLFGLILIYSRKYCSFTGILLALYCVKLFFYRKGWKWGLICGLAMIILSGASITSMIYLDSDFDETSKFHAMTRGVLFGSGNPAKTLEEFDIDPSYEVLADVSSYDPIPFVNAENPILEKGFLDSYSTVDICMYYVRHPNKFLGMLDVAIKSCFGIRRDSCGNYEKNVGLPPRAKSLFWSVWSTFKNNSAPKTIGYLAVLAAAAVLLYGRGYSLRPNDSRRNVVLLDSMLMLTSICIVLAGITVVYSGDAEMIRRCFPISSSIDLMTYLIFAEIVHKINIF